MRQAVEGDQAMPFGIEAELAHRAVAKAHVELNAALWADPQHMCHGRRDGPAAGHHQHVGMGRQAHMLQRVDHTLLPVPVRDADGFAASVAVAATDPVPASDAVGLMLLPLVTVIWTVSEWVLPRLSVTVRENVSVSGLVGASKSGVAVVGFRMVTLVPPVWVHE